MVELDEIRGIAWCFCFTSFPCGIVSLSLAKCESCFCFLFSQSIIGYCMCEEIRTSRNWRLVMGLMWGARSSVMPAGDYGYKLLHENLIGIIKSASLIINWKGRHWFLEVKLYMKLLIFEQLWINWGNRLVTGQNLHDKNIISDFPKRLDCAISRSNFSAGVRVRFP